MYWNQMHGYKNICQETPCHEPSSIAWACAGRSATPTKKAMVFRNRIRMELCVGRALSQVVPRLPFQQVLSKLQSVRRPGRIVCMMMQSKAKQRTIPNKAPLRVKSRLLRAGKLIGITWAMLKHCFGLLLLGQILRAVLWSARVGLRRCLLWLGAL